MQGTEYYDGKLKRYIDFPITDVLQMMGRAGRPQYDQHGKAVILVHEPKKSFYKKVSATENIRIVEDVDIISLAELKFEFFHLTHSFFLVSI